MNEITGQVLGPISLVDHDCLNFFSFVHIFSEVCEVDLHEEKWLPCLFEKMAELRIRLTVVW